MRYIDANWLLVVSTNWHQCYVVATSLPSTWNIAPTYFIALLGDNCLDWIGVELFMQERDNVLRVLDL